jgi:hypothetical protein
MSTLDDQTDRPFEQLAAGACPSYLELMLALGTEFSPVDAAAVRDRVDDDSRALFGVAALPPLQRADRLAEVLARELGFSTDAGGGATGLLLHEVVARRRGHPALVAAIGAELALRAGVPAGVYASPRRWFTGIGAGEELVVLDPSLADGSADAPDELRAACAHELAFCVLCGLGAAYTQQGDDAAARHAGRLRHALPVQPRRA